MAENISALFHFPQTIFIRYTHTHTYIILKVHHCLGRDGVEYYFTIFFPFIFLKWKIKSQEGSPYCYKTVEINLGQNGLTFFITA